MLPQGLISITLAILLVTCSTISAFSATSLLDEAVLETNTATDELPSVPLSALQPGSQITLEQAVQIALSNNPELLATKWDTISTAAQIRMDRSERWPTLSVEGSYMSTLDDQRLLAARFNGEDGIFDDQFYRGDLVLKVPLYAGGRIVNEIKASESLNKSAEKHLARTRQELIFNVSSVFYSLLEQKEVIRSLTFSAGAMEEHLKQMSELLKVQKAAKVDLLRTEVRIADLRQNLIREQNVFAAEKRLLANLIGADTEINTFTIAGSLTIAPFLSRPANEYIDEALQLRDDFQAAKAALEAQKSTLKAAKAGHLPSVSLLGSYGARMSGSGDSEDNGTIGLGVSLPLFEGGRTDAQISQELARLKAAQNRLRKLELQIRREVESALFDIHSSYERINATQLAVEQAKESLRIERLKYDLSSGSLTDILDAQAALLNAETNYARGQADYHIATERLKLATGDK